MKAVPRGWSLAQRCRVSKPCADEASVALRRRIERIRLIARERGLIALCWLGFAKLLSPFAVCRWLILLEGKLDGTPIGGPPHGLSIAPADAAQLEEIVTFEYGPYPHPSNSFLTGRAELLAAYRASARARRLDQMFADLRRNDACFVAREGGDIVLTAWMRTGRAQVFPGFNTGLEDGHVLVEDPLGTENRADPVLHRAVMDQLFAYAQRQGYRRAFAATEATRARGERIDGSRWSVRGKVLYFRLRRMRRAVFIRIAGRVDPIFSQAGSGMRTTELREATQR